MYARYFLHSLGLPHDKKCPINNIQEASIAECDSNNVPRIVLWNDIILKLKCKRNLNCSLVSLGPVKICHEKDCRDPFKLAVSTEGEIYLLINQVLPLYTKVE